MNKREKQELIRMLRDMRTALDVPPPKDADAVQRMNHFAYLVGKAQVVLDSALITLST
jgi:inactivated superfamily I helicase